jgi:hypothetical protein
MMDYAVTNTLMKKASFMPQYPQPQKKRSILGPMLGGLGILGGGLLLNQHLNPTRSMVPQTTPPPMPKVDINSLMSKIRTNVASAQSQDIAQAYPNIKGNSALDSAISMAQFPMLASGGLALSGKFLGSMLPSSLKARAFNIPGITSLNRFASSKALGGALGASQGYEYGSNPYIADGWSDLIKNTTGTDVDPSKLKYLTGGIGAAGNAVVGGKLPLVGTFLPQILTKGLDRGLPDWAPGSFNTGVKDIADMSTKNNYNSEVSEIWYKAIKDLKHNMGNSQNVANAKYLLEQNQDIVPTMKDDYPASWSLVQKLQSELAKGQHE